MHFFSEISNASSDRSSLFPGVHTWAWSLLLLFCASRSIFSARWCSRGCVATCFGFGSILPGAWILARNVVCRFPGGVWDNFRDGRPLFGTIRAQLGVGLASFGVTCHQFWSSSLGWSWSNANPILPSCFARFRRWESNSSVPWAGSSLVKTTHPGQTHQLNPLCLAAYPWQTRKPVRSPNAYLASAGLVCTGTYPLACLRKFAD